MKNARKLGISKIIFGDTNRVRVFLSDGSELSFLSNVETEAGLDDLIKFRIEGFLVKSETECSSQPS